MPHAREDDPIVAALPAALRRWSRSDRVLAAIARAHPPPRRQLGGGDPFAALVESLVHQQVSLAAGRAIAGRLTAACGGTVSPRSVADLGADGLRRAGLSRPKASYVADLARRVEDGSLNFARIAEASDEDAIAALVEVRGVGVWTAKMFLLFHLGRPDVLAVEDLGLQIAVAKAYKVPRARAARKMERLLPAWSPYASLASLTLWNWRRVADGRPAGNA